MASNTLAALSETLIESVQAVQAYLPDKEFLQPPDNGISLLDIKNDVFLAYLQNLVFLILLKFRNGQSTIKSKGDHAAGTDDGGIQEEVVKKLIELRVYLEKGVKPLEGRLRYQIDKVVRAAEDADRKASTSGSNKTKKTKASRTNGTSAKAENDGSSASETDSDESQEIDPLAYRPNPGAFVGNKDSSNNRSSKGSEAPPRIYRPPRIAATSMPEVGAARAERAAARPQKSATIDEFIASELSTAPMAEPSIGTTIRQGGRRSVTARERQEAREREAYEEAHFIRLPKESKAERRKKGAGRPRDAGWGGEEWRDIGRGAERVTSALGSGRRSGHGSKVREALQRSRKRDRESGDTNHGGAKIGEAFERSKRRLDAGGKKRRVN